MMHRVFITIGNFDIYSYAVMMVIAIIAALLLAQSRAKNTPYQELILDFSLYLIISGTIGARLLYILLNIAYYQQHLLEILNLRQGGLSLYGGLAGGLAGALLFCSQNKVNFPSLADLVAPSLFVGQAIGRIGCLLNGCCYGKITRLPWGIDLSAVDITGLRHPVQVYEIILDIIALFVLLIYEKRQSFKGELILSYFALYSLVRFSTEFWRESQPLALGLSLAQFFSLGLFLVFVLVILKLKKEKPQIKEVKRHKS
jgi:phosphatidylglycerol---prolipoprotein diacylglyceryl transferase